MLKDLRNEQNMGKKQLILDNFYKKLSFGLSDSANKAKNECELKNRDGGTRNKSWWDDTINILHIKQCMAYRNYELTLYKGKKERDDYHSARNEF